jgi:type IV pilus assembly protein PilA
MALDSADVYAPFFRRFFALLLDYGLVVLGFAAATALLGANQNGADDGGFRALATLVVAWLYKAGMECSAKQGTLGKLVLGIKVVSLDGGRIGFGRATGRFFALLLSAVILYIGFLMAAFSKRRQALHDMIAGTLVVKANARSEDVILAGPARPAGGAAVAAIVLVVGIPLFGILAAIAIPAYQDYTLRAQVSEGLNLAAAPKAAVAEAFLSRGTVPANRTRAGMSSDPTDTHGKYVTSVAITDGRVDITYGNEAHTMLAGKVLSITPYGLRESGGLSMAWRCGLAPAPLNATQLTDYAPGAIEAKYLPSACRP